MITYWVENVLQGDRKVLKPEQALWLHKIVNTLHTIELSLQNS